MNAREREVMELRDAAYACCECFDEVPVKLHERLCKAVAAYDAIIADTRAGEGVEAVNDGLAEHIVAWLLNLAPNTYGSIKYLRQDIRMALQSTKPLYLHPQPAQGGQGQQSNSRSGEITVPKHLLLDLLDHNLEAANIALAIHPSIDFIEAHGGDESEDDLERAAYHLFYGLFAANKLRESLESAQSQTPPKEQGQRREITDEAVAEASRLFCSVGVIPNCHPTDDTTKAIRAVLEWYESTRAPQPHGASAGSDVRTEQDAYELGYRNPSASSRDFKWKHLVDVNAFRSGQLDYQNTNPMNREYRRADYDPDTHEKLATPSQPSCVQDARDGEYRLLNRDEVIEATDQILDDNCVDWLPPVGWEVGLKHDHNVFVPIRRRVATADGAAARRGLTRAFRAGPAAITAKPGKGETK